MIKIVKWALKALLVLATLLLVFLLVATTYLESHKRAIFEDFENWYAQHHNGILTFDDIEVSSLRNFPNVSFSVDNLVLVDSLFNKHKTESLRIGRVELLVSAQKLMQQEIQFKSLILKNGDFRLITDKDGNQNHSVFMGDAPLGKRNTPTGDYSSSWFPEEGTEVIVENFRMLIEDHQKEKRYNAKINEIETRLVRTDSLLTGPLTLDIIFDEMAFNLKKGAYFNGAHLMGTMLPEYHLHTKGLNVPFFDLKIDEQTFRTKADITLEGQGTFHFVIENIKTDVKETLGLLTDKLRKKLEKYHVKNTIRTNANLYGSFAPKSNPLVKINFETKDNELRIGDTLKIRNTSFIGDFINRLYDDKRAYHESVKDFRLRFTALEGNWEKMHFKSTSALLSSSEAVPTFIDTEMDISGKVADLNALLNNETFLLQEGDFELAASFNGDASHIDSLLHGSSSSFTMNAVKVLHTPTSLLIPIDTLGLKIEKENAILELLKVPIGITGDHLFLKGKVTNLTSLAFNGNDQVTSDLSVSSNRLVWADFKKLFNALKKDSVETVATEKVPEHNVFNSVLRDVYTKFEPKLEVQLGSGRYQDFRVKNVVSGFYFPDINGIRLDKTGFEYRGGKIDLNIDFDISKPKETVFAVTFITDKLPVGEFLEDFQYFDIQALKDIEKLAGKITMNVEMSGSILDDSGLDMKSLAGNMMLAIEDLEIKGFQPLEEVADKIFKKSRFEDIRFSSLKDTFYFKNQTLEIPQMEIESTAFDFFVEGHLSFKDATNIWVSVPLANLKHRDIKDIPDKKGYIDSGKKVFVEVKNDDNGKLGYQFHLNDKKLFEEKGILGQYKEAHKNERKLRREDKREARKAKREARKAQHHKAKT